MNEDIADTLILVLVFLAALTFGWFCILWSNECAAAGGAYIIPQGGFPVCVREVKW